ncbi:hypothetical protein [Streptomyces albospinus]|uniref:hypothetical protein n=1 Tax=Streptomyces albospinus TaxID=285515 RepID=UPI00166FB0C5|nr:hypothetical protein [Streptomyces albospinus]
MTTATPAPGRYAIDVPRSEITFTVAKAKVDDEIVVEATATVDRYSHGVTKLKGMAGGPCG